ncbi:hypothetical protein WT95_18915 [Burkholderia stagnalis]|nr:hypothetical protein WT95_18915 [Burkholderia stagnalis]KWO41531.1 hypothetical protein WT96_05830 [Burkholderia stagnalis]
MDEPVVECFQEAFDAALHLRRARGAVDDVRSKLSARCLQVLRMKLETVVAHKLLDETVCAPLSADLGESFLQIRFRQDRVLEATKD